MRVIILLTFLILCSCTTVRHKSISRTYHGTNGKGGHWTVWRMPYKTSGDSVAISASGYNVSRKEKVKFGAFYALSAKGDTIRVDNDIPYQNIYVKLPAGKYRLGFQPIAMVIGTLTKPIKLSAGDSIALHANVVQVEGHFHDDEDAKYKSPKKRAREKRKIARDYKKLEKIRARNAKRYPKEEQ